LANSGFPPYSSRTTSITFPINPACIASVNSACQLQGDFDIEVGYQLLEWPAPQLVNVSLDTSNGIRMTVGVAGTHRNSIVGILGMPSWQVSTTATALAGFPDHARAVSPFIFSVSAFGTDGTPKYQTPTNFGEGNGDIPNNDIDFAWTNYGTGNVDTGAVDDMIKGDLTIDKTLEFGDYIGQQNAGYHSFLFSDVNTYMAGQDWPAAIVDATLTAMSSASSSIRDATPTSARVQKSDVPPHLPYRGILEPNRRSCGHAGDGS